MDVHRLAQRLDRSVRAGIITAEQAARILALEASDEPQGPAAPVSDTGAAESRRGLIAEVVGYVGSAFALGAIALLVGEYWVDLAVWARVTLTALLAVLALGAGAVLHRRPDATAPSAALARLVGVLWALGTAASAWTVGIVAWDVIGVAERWMPTTVGGLAALLAAALLARGRHVPVQLALFVALGSAVTGTLVAIAPLEPGPLAYGALLLGGGATWAVAGAGGWLGPRLSAEVTGGIFVLIGAQVLTASAWPRATLVVGILVALALVATSMLGARTHLLVLGALGLFISVPRLVLALFADTLGAPVALLTTGLLLILIAVGVGRLRRTQQGAPDG